VFQAGAQRLGIAAGREFIAVSDPNRC